MFLQTYPGGEKDTLTTWTRVTLAWQLSTMTHITVDRIVVQAARTPIAITLARSHQKTIPTDTRAQFIRG